MILQNTNENTKFEIPEDIQSVINMKSFEPVFEELEDLFIKKLPCYIEKVNKDYNDGIILKPFANTTLTENCIKTLSFVLNIEETVSSEKDRIIEKILSYIKL